MNMNAMFWILPDKEGRRFTRSGAKLHGKKELFLFVPLQNLKFVLAQGHKNLEG